MEKFNTKGRSFWFLSEVLEVTDGDTIVVMAEMGMGSYRKQSIRFLDIDAFETRSKDKKEKEIGLKEKEFLKSLLPVGSLVYINTLKKDIYGRWLAFVYKVESDGMVNLKLSVNDIMREIIMGDSGNV